MWLARNGAGIPIPVLMAIMYQESSLGEGEAPRLKVFGVIP